MKVLIVEDNKILSGNIAKYLELENIESKQLFEGKEVLLEIVSSSYDLIILDLGLPDIDGNDLCYKIRDHGKNIPILMLTARDTVNDKIKGFKSGADDYLTKPFNYEELIVRIEALVRRTFSVKSDNIKLENNIEIDLNNKLVKRDNLEIHLSKLEFELLKYLSQNKGLIATKEELLEKVWGEYDDFNQTRTVDVYIGYLRKKLGKDVIETIRGQGYTIK